MSQNISLHSLLEEAEISHRHKSHDKDMPTFEESGESDTRTEIEKLRIETAV